MTLRAISPPPPPHASRLLVLLHGWGANAQDVAGLATYLSLPSHQLIFPEGPFVHPMAPQGRMWYSFPNGYDFRQTHAFEQQVDLQQSRRELKAWMLSLADSTGIGLEQTVMGGFSQGGAMTLDVGLQLPLAGLLVLSGYAHATLNPPVSPRPVLLMHGRQDPVVPIERARSAKTQLEQQGLTVDYREFDAGHEITPAALAVAEQFCQTFII
ncbi:hypothetical protein IQ241_12160 [Romeria aff. gracilis LEGE 07310]|uniref:Phospholipase/carboxylesterase/thioesterase domain-containing protein n=1 Tax=Vasconcelosia minhoensis LEGE 07310 TaxID=915328 RepID=A0A8J7DCU3_9CYAN|nr:hypothetical protein [Romeria gracilis]MBE9078038.1 hypothetical protein [Romeria aff. gracilis LEGE 07310]